MTFGVILAGGVGERFWPKSRTRHPKQFLAITEKRTLLEKSLHRLSGVVSPKRIRIVAPLEQRSPFRTYSSLKERMIWEPFGRNTAPAVALAAFEIKQEDPGAVLVVLPCDQWIQEEKKFLSVLRKGVEVAEIFEGIVTIGVRPTYPATGFGYIAHARRPEKYGKGKAYPVSRFIEKPNLKSAKRLFRKKSILWNTGIFIFQIPVFLSALRRHLPMLHEGLLKWEKAKGRVNKGRVLSALYRKFRPLSLDYGILEHEKNICVLPGNFGWGDLGSWCSISWHSLGTSLSSQDKNVLIGDAYVADGKDNLFVSEKGHLLAGIGVSDVVLVHTADATLLCPKERAEDVKRLVSLLKKNKAFSRYC